jgi:hypothetical protein
MPISDSSNSVDANEHLSCDLPEAVGEPERESVVKIRGFTVELETMPGLFRTLCGRSQSF